MQPLKTPVVLPEYLQAAFADMTNALSDQFEKHGLNQEEIAFYLAGQLTALLPDLGKTEFTTHVHQTLPIRIGLLDAHKNSAELMLRADSMSDAEIAVALDQLRDVTNVPASFSTPYIARQWFRLFMATNQ